MASTYRTLLRPLTMLLIISGVLNIVLWLFSWWFMRQQTAAAVLHYSTAVGIDFIGESNQIITLPLIGLSIIVGNLIVGAGLRSSDPRTSWILWGIMPIAQIILLSALGLIWQVNQ